MQTLRRFLCPSDASSCPVPEDFPVYTADYDTLKDLVGYHLTGGVLCAMRRKPLPSVSEVCRGAKRIAVLENVVNPTNIGAIFRSAAALNIDAVLLTMACCDPLLPEGNPRQHGQCVPYPLDLFTARPEEAAPPTTGRAPMNGSTRIMTGQPTLRPTDRAGLPPGLNGLKPWATTTAAMALDDDSVSVSDPALKKAEKTGHRPRNGGRRPLKAHTIANCDYTVKIPMAPGGGFLNVAAASAVAFWITP